MLLTTFYSLYSSRTEAKMVRILFAPFIKKHLKAGPHLPLTPPQTTATPIADSSSSDSSMQSDNDEAIELPTRDLTSSAVWRPW